MLHVNDDATEAEPLVFLDEARSVSTVPCSPNVPYPLMLIKHNGGWYIIINLVQNCIIHSSVYTICGLSVAISK